MTKKMTKRWTKLAFSACLAVMALAAVGTFSVKARAAKTPQKAYAQFLKENVGKDRYFQIVNIGEKNSPVLIVGEGEKLVFKKKKKVCFTACLVYAYVDGEVKQAASFDGSYGEHCIGLYEKNGKNYLRNGLSDVAAFYRIKKGKAITHEYFNCYSGKGADRTQVSVFKKDGTVTKELGYLTAEEYETRRDSYTMVESAVSFVKNTKANRKKGLAAK